MKFLQRITHHPFSGPKVTFSLLSAVALGAVLTISPSNAAGGSIAITSPSAGTTALSPQYISAKTSGLSGVSNVTFFANNVAIKKVNGCSSIQLFVANSYGTCWKTSTLANGTYSLVAKAKLSNSTVVTSRAVLVKVANNVPPTTPPSTTAYFQIRDDWNDTFVFALNDPAKIAEARSLIGSSKFPAGIIVRQSASYNAPWHYTLDPNSIVFTDFAIEVCDSTIAYVEAHLAEVGGSFLPGNRWCGWGNRLIAEVHPTSISNSLPK